ncbi:AarF/UbiB family protein [Deltaproteobacteria bacterium TL4]
MDLEKLVKDSVKWLEDLGNKATQWSSEFNLDERIEKIQKRLPEISEEILTHLEQWESNISDYLDNILPTDQQLIQTFEAIQASVRKEWLEMEGLLRLGNRYMDAVETLITIVVRTQMFEYSVSSVPENEREAKREQLHQENAWELTTLCKRQGGAWVKAAQFLSCRSDLLPPVYISALSELQDQAPSVPWEQMVQVLEAELGEHWQDHFRTIETHPIATASIAQVHKAELKDGFRIAVKIQLPDAAEKIEADLKFFKTVAHLMNSRVKGLDLEQIMTELAKNILLELDYYHEAANLTRFHVQYQATQWKFPGLIHEVLSQRVLGMTFMEGTPVRQFLKEVPSAAESLLKEMVYSFVQQIFISGVFHADPHPGNFFVNPRGKLVLLDFGTMGQLNAEETEKFRKILMALLLKQEEGTVELLQEAGFEISDGEKLKQALFHRPNEEEGLSKIRFYLNMMHEVGVKMPDNFVLMARVLVSIGGLLNQYHVKLDMKELACSLMKK